MHCTFLFGDLYGLNMVSTALMNNSNLQPTNSWQSSRTTSPTHAEKHASTANVIRISQNYNSFCLNLCPSKLHASIRQGTRARMNKEQDMLHITKLTRRAPIFIFLHRYVSRMQYAPKLYTSYYMFRYNMHLVCVFCPMSPNKQFPWFEKSRRNKPRTSQINIFFLHSSISEIFDELTVEHWLF